MNFLNTSQNINLEKIYTTGFLIFLISISSCIKFKFLFQESLLPDEALYLFIARNLSNDATNLTDITGEIFYQSPPLLTYILSLFANISFITFDQVARILVSIMGIATVPITYFIGKKIYSPIVGLLAACFFATCPLNNWNGVRILTDGPVVFFIYLSICMLVYDKKIFFYIFALCAILTKYSAFPLLFLPLFMRMKSWAWSFIYGSIFISLSVFVIAKDYLPEPDGWLNYFYKFFKMPNAFHMVGEAQFFLGYFVIALFIVGLLTTVKQKNYSALFHWVCVFGVFRIFLPWTIFRVSRYTMPLYPGLYIFAAFGAIEIVRFVALKWPVYKKWAVIFFTISLFSVFFNNCVKSFDLLNRTQNTFIGFRNAANFLGNQPEPHTIATASPRQMKYYIPDFDVYDIPYLTSPESLKELINEKNINYIYIELWSPHLPEWCKSYNYAKNNYRLIFNEKNIYIFKVKK